MCTYSKTEAKHHYIGKILSETKYVGTGLVFGKTDVLYVELKSGRQPPVVILQQSNFGNVFILCLCLRIITRSDQGA